MLKAIVELALMSRAQIHTLSYYSEIALVNHSIKVSISEIVKYVVYPSLYRLINWNYLMACLQFQSSLSNIYHLK